MQTYTLKVLSIKMETNDTYTISFKQPGLRKIKYLPGQYLTLIININNRKYFRPYSFSSSPGIDANLEITVKRVLHGIVSNHLIDVVKEDDLIEVMPPMGDFYFDQLAHMENDIFLWGGGSGITPLMSILKFVLASQNKKVTLTVCNKTKGDTIFYNQLVSFKDKYPFFNLNLFCTKELNDDTLFGRIDEKSISNIADISLLRKAIHFICGPEGLKENVKSYLIDHQVDSRSVYSEDFGHLISESDLEGVQTRKIDVIKNDKNSTVEVIRGKSILESCLDYGLDIPYSCQTGTCHLCKAKLIAGSIKVVGNDKSDKILYEDEYLLCCSYPFTDQVVLKID